MILAFFSRLDQRSRRSPPHFSFLICPVLLSSSPLFSQAVVIIPHLAPLTEEQPFPEARVAYSPGAQLGQMPQLPAQHPDYLARAQQQGYGGSAQWGNFPVGHHMTRPVMHQGMHTWQQPQQQPSNFAAHQPITNRPQNCEDPQPLGRQDFI